MPGYVRDPSQRAGQHPERFQLAPTAHHRHAHEERNLRIGTQEARDTRAATRAVTARHAGPGVDERRKTAKSCTAAGWPFGIGHAIRVITRIMGGGFEAADKPFEAGHVVGVERDHPDGPRERRRDGAMAVPPCATRLLRRVRCLRDDVGDPQPGADAGADPVRRLVVEVVREPAPRRPRRTDPAIEQPLHLGPPDVRQPVLAAPVTDAVERPQPRRQRHFVAGPLQRAHQQSGDEPIPRGNGVVRRLEGRVERDLHDPGS